MPPDTPRRTFTGVCAGGPLDGQHVTVRFPSGFLAVNRPANRCWLYDLTGETFTVREPEGRDLDHGKRIFAALDDNEYDVLAVP